MQFSHHSSNPLEVRTSDSLNVRYHDIIDTVNQNREGGFFASSDELGQWVEKENYQSHIGQVTHNIIANDMTPQAGPSRLPENSCLVDLEEDEDMQSDDPIAIPSVKRPAKSIESPTKVNKVVDEDAFLRFQDEDVEIDMGREEEHAVEIEQEGVQVAGAEDGDNQGDEYLEYEEYEDEETFIIHDDDEIMHDEDEDDTRPQSRSSNSSGRSCCSSDRSSCPYSSPQSSRPSSPDEALTLNKRPQEEQDAIADEIVELSKAMPQLEDSYRLVDRLGTGTFSSVYKAIDLNYDDWYNKPWLGHHPPESSAYYQSAGPGYKGRGGRAQGWRYPNGESSIGRNYTDQLHGNVFVAVKRIYTTSGPERIRNELSIMEDCRGCRHTSQIITAFRHEDQVVIVLPYQRNMDFRVSPRLRDVLFSLPSLC